MRPGSGRGSEARAPASRSRPAGPILPSPGDPASSWRESIGNPGPSRERGRSCCLRPRRVRIRRAGPSGDTMSRCGPTGSVPAPAGPTMLGCSNRAPRAPVCWWCCLPSTRARRSGRSCVTSEPATPTTTCSWWTTGPRTTPQRPRGLRGPSCAASRSTWVSAVPMRTAYKFAERHGYQVVVQVDADGQHDPSYIEKLVDGLADSDLIIGARFAGVGEAPVPRCFADSPCVCSPGCCRGSRSDLSPMSPAVSAPPGRAA